MHVTIAGVNKSKAFDEPIPGYPTVQDKDGKYIITNAMELESLDNLRTGFVFRLCGGSGVVYNECEPHVEMLDGHPLTIASSVIITPSEYRVSDRNVEDETEFYRWDVVDDWAESF